MSVTSGRFVVRRDGVVVDADVSWSLGPAVSSADVAGAEASATWHDRPTVATTDDDRVLDGEPVTVDWVDADGEHRVLTATVETTGGGSLQESSSRLADGTPRLSRTLDLRPTARALPPHPEGDGRPRRVGLLTTWFTHQAMTSGGFDPGVPLHWSCVWYQSMCGSAATVPDQAHAWAPLGEVWTAHAASDPDAYPRWLQGPDQVVAADVHTYGVTARPRAGTLSAPWQVTVDLPVVDGESSEGEVVLRDREDGTGVRLAWSASLVSVRSVAAGGATTLVLQEGRDPAASRWSVVVDGGTATLYSDALGETPVASATGVFGMPGGLNRPCTVEVDSPGVVGAVAVSRPASTSHRTYMVTRPVEGRVVRADLTRERLVGWLGEYDVQAGRVLTDQADACRGLRAQPVWMWVDADGVLVNTDFQSLAAAPVALTFDTAPGGGALALDLLQWRTDPPGGPWTGVRVTGVGTTVSRRSSATLLLAEGSTGTLEDGDAYEVLLHPEEGTAWLDVDMTPLMAGFSYPSPPYPANHKHAAQRRNRSIVGGYLVDEDDNDSAGWAQPKHLGWRVGRTGHVLGAMEMLDPRTVVVRGVADLPSGTTLSTQTAPGSRGLTASRRGQPLPQLRGRGRVNSLEREVFVPIAGTNVHHAPYTHDCGVWVQHPDDLARVASCLHDSITRPTPVRTAQVQLDGRVQPGVKIALVERRLDGIVVTEELVVARVSASTAGEGDAMDVEGVVTARRVVQTDPAAPPVDTEEEWTTPPPNIPTDPPRETDPPEQDPEDDVPPVSAPVAPSAPSVSVSLAELVITWDGQAAGGGDGVGPDHGMTQVAVGQDSGPTSIVGSLFLTTDGSWRLGHVVDALGTSWYVRLRTVDRWGNESAWGPQVQVGVPQIVDADQFEQVRGQVTTGYADPTPADATGKPEGALWHVYDEATGDLLRSWRLVAGIWVDAALSPTYVPKIDIGSGTFGDLTGDRIDALSVAAEVGEFVYVKANHIEAGDVNVALNLTAGGSITVGSTLGDHVVVGDGKVEARTIGQGGAPITTASMGGTDNSFGAYGPDGGLLGGIDADGTMSTPHIDAETVSLAGDDLAATIDALPKGQLMYAREYDSTVGPYTARTGIYELTFDVIGGRSYALMVNVRGRNPGSRFWTHGLSYTFGVSGTPSAPLVGSTVLATNTVKCGLADDSIYDDRPTWFVYEPTQSGTVRFLHWVEPGDSGSSGVQTRMHRYLVWDAGPSTDNVGRPSLGGAGGVPPEEDLPTRDYDRMWYPTTHQVWTQSGAGDTYAPQWVRSGNYSPAFSSVYRTFVMVPQNMRDALSGASTSQINLRLTQVSGFEGAPWIGWTNTDTITGGTEPPNFDATQAARTFKTGSTRWFRLPAAVEAAVASGAAKGIVVGRRVAVTNQDFAGTGASLTQRPKFRTWYRK